ncbi:MAG: Hsp20/alpha crystallin family protein [Candidatus Binataceae bacterium]
MELRIENGLDNKWLLDRMNGFWKDYSGAARHIVPATDIVEDQDAYHFYFEMPGLKRDSVEVKVEDERLMLAAERKRPELPENTEVHMAERSYGLIQRSFRLPKDASSDRINASYQDGVLEVTVEKRAEAKPVKIQVN